MRVQKKGKSITLWLDEETANRLDKVAQRAGLSRSRLAENLLLVGLDEAETLKKIGVLQLAVLLRDLHEKVSKRMADVKEIAGELA
jgi:metal-responsive CopG/Arc/MetJ family transcriptional regulator